MFFYLRLRSLKFYSGEINRIYHHNEGGTRESHPSVQDLQSWIRLAKSWILQILNMRMGFPCPFHNVVIVFSTLHKNVQNRYKMQTRCNFLDCLALTFCGVRDDLLPEWTFLSLHGGTFRLTSNLAEIAVSRVRKCSLTNSVHMNLPTPSFAVKSTMTSQRPLWHQKKLMSKCKERIKFNIVYFIFKLVHVHVHIVQDLQHAKLNKPPRWLQILTRGPKGHKSCTWVQCATFFTD